MTRCVQGIGLHVKPRTESRTARTGAYTALHVYLRDGRSHVGHVHPENRLTLLIVQLYLIHRHVDTRMVGTAYAEIGVPHSQTVITRHLQSRCCREQIRQVLTRVITVQFLVFHYSRREGRLLHTFGTHLDVFQLMHQDR